MSRGLIVCVEISSQGKSVLVVDLREIPGSLIRVGIIVWGSVAFTSAHKPGYSHARKHATSETVFEATSKTLCKTCLANDLRRVPAHKYSLRPYRANVAAKLKLHDCRRSERVRPRSSRIVCKVIRVTQQTDKPSGTGHRRAIVAKAEPKRV